MLDVLPNRLKQTLIHWLQKPPVGIDLSQLSFAATDLWAHYREGVHTVFPKVSVVADRFHVVQNLHEVIHQVRRQAQKEATSPEERQQLKGLRYLLLKNEHKLTEKEQIRLQTLAQTHPTLSQLVQLRQQLYAWYEIRTSPEFATMTLHHWLEKARVLNLPSLNKFCQTIETWRTEIVNFFEHRITSGFVEGMNSKIRLLKRIAFGIPNHEHFRLRVIAFCG